MDYRRRLVSGRLDGHADAGPLRIDPAGRQLLAQQRRSVHLHGSLGGSRPANSVHDCPTAFAILFPIGRPRLHLRPDRIGNLGQKDAGRGSSTSGLASSSLQAQGTVPYKVSNQKLFRSKALWFDRVPLVCTFAPVLSIQRTGFAEETYTVEATLGFRINTRVPYIIIYKRLGRTSGSKSVYLSNRATGPGTATGPCPYYTSQWYARGLWLAPSCQKFYEALRRRSMRNIVVLLLFDYKPSIEYRLTFIVK